MYKWKEEDSLNDRRKSLNKKLKWLASRSVRDHEIYDVIDYDMRDQTHMRVNEYFDRAMLRAHEEIRRAEAFIENAMIPGEQYPHWLTSAQATPNDLVEAIYAFISDWQHGATKKNYDKDTQMMFYRRLEALFKDIGKYVPQNDAYHRNANRWREYDTLEEYMEENGNQS